MAYLALALKYRPKNFKEVVGQEHVVMSLKNAIAKDRVHHAYLFSGPRGVGKTSLARILAKALNCQRGPTVDPCGECASCLEIAKGSSLDIIEIDAASNRGIDEIRTLRENVKLSSAGSRYKIYIIDEVHMLTQEAFNALLKTLEEPPEHVKFIFATTHFYKVLPTILSRCQKFQFNLLPLESIVGKLKKIVAAEKVEIKENILYTIGRAAEGSIRDAESLLDQLIPVILEKKSLDDVFSFLGIIDEDNLNQLLKHLIEKDLGFCLDFVEKTVRDGKDLGIFLNAFIEHLRNLLLAKVSLRSFEELSDISPQSKDFIVQISKTITANEILEIIDSLLEAKDLSYRLNTVRIPLELALVKYSYNEAKSNPAPDNQQKNIVNKYQPEASEEVQPDPKEADDSDWELEDFNLPMEEEQIQPGSKQKEKNEAEAGEDSLEADDCILQPLKVKWEEIIASIQKTRAALASHLSYGLPFSSSGQVITIAFSTQDYFHKEIVEDSKNLNFIEEVISGFMAKKIKLRFVNKELSERIQPTSTRTCADNAENSKHPLKSQEQIGSDDEFLNEILDTFGGKFHTDES